MSQKKCLDENVALSSVQTVSQFEYQYWLLGLVVTLFRSISESLGYEKLFFFFYHHFHPLLPKKGSVVRHFKLSQWKPAIKQPIIDLSASNYETHKLINVTAKMSNVTKLASNFFL